jgi:dTMP kinase
MRGVLITFEGVEGSGKSSQCRLLAEKLRARGVDVVVTSEPDGTALGVAIRASLNTDGPSPSPLSQVFLFLAARHEHVIRVIRPALARGAVVLSDRYVDATVAYQGFGHGVELDVIRDLNLLATGGVLPDLTLVLDLDPAVGISRIAGRALDAFERLDLAFHRRVRDGYLEIARSEKRRVVVLSADHSEEAVALDVMAAVGEVLPRRDGAHVE